MKTKNIIMGVSALALIAFLSMGVPAFANNNGKDKNDDKRPVSSVVAPSLMVNVSQDGQALVRGARVSAVTGTTVSATTTWNNGIIMNWVVNTNANTKFVRSNGTATPFSEIAIGDTISFSGALTSSSPMTVQASALKDWSLQPNRTTFVGAVTSVNVAGQTFVMTPNNQAAITVQVMNSTEFKKNSDAATLATLAIGSKVTVSGVFNSDNRVLQADSVKIKVEDNDHIRGESFRAKIKSFIGGWFDRKDR